MTLQLLLASARSAALRHTITDAARSRYRVRFCADAGDLAQAMMEPDASLLVCELQPGADCAMKALGDAMRVLGREVPIILRLDLSRSAARQVVTLAEHLPRARVSLSGFDSLSGAIAVEYHELLERSAHSAIARRLLPIVPSRAADIVAAAVMVGDRRISVQALAHLCGMPLRTLEWRLRTAGIAPARSVLGWVLALHSLWRLEHLGWTSKRAALAAGFTAPAPWSNFVTRHAGARPSALLQEGFEAVFARLSGSISRLSEPRCR